MEYSLEDDKFSNFMKLVLSELNQSRKLSKIDCNLVLESKEGTLHPSHKCVLLTASDFFRSVVQHDASVNDTGRLNLPTVSSEHIEAILDFYYTGELTLKSICHLTELIEVADYLQLTTLIEVCQQLGLSNLSEVTWFPLWRAARNLDTLRRSASHWAARYLTLSQSLEHPRETFLTLTLDEAEQLLSLRFLIVQQPIKEENAVSYADTHSFLIGSEFVKVLIGLARSWEERNASGDLLKAIGFDSDEDIASVCSNYYFFSVPDRCYAFPVLDCRQSEEFRTVQSPDRYVLSGVAFYCDPNEVALAGIVLRYSDLWDPTKSNEINSITNFRTQWKMSSMITLAEFEHVTSVTMFYAENTRDGHGQVVVGLRFITDAREPRSIEWRSTKHEESVREENYTLEQVRKSVCCFSCCLHTVQLSMNSHGLVTDVGLGWSALNEPTGYTYFGSKPWITLQSDRKSLMRTRQMME